jgi:hypothetical protein
VADGDATVARAETLATPATLATSAAEPAETLTISGSRPLATFGYLATPDWADDRAWIARMLRARAEAATLETLAEWVATAGGETVGRTVMLPALRPHRERRLAELELRRMCRQFGLEILEDEA